MTQDTHIPPFKANVIMTKVTTSKHSSFDWQLTTTSATSTHTSQKGLQNCSVSASAVSMETVWEMSIATATKHGGKHNKGWLLVIAQIKERMQLSTDARLAKVHTNMRTYAKVCNIMQLKDALRK